MDGRMNGLLVDKWIDLESLVDGWINGAMDDTSIVDWCMDDRPTDRPWMDGLSLVNRCRLKCVWMDELVDYCCIKDE